MRPEIATRLENISNLALALAANCRNGQAVELMTVQTHLALAEISEVYILLGRLQVSGGQNQ